MFELLIDADCNNRLVNKYPYLKRHQSLAQTMALRTKGQPMKMTIWTLLHKVRAEYRSPLIPAAANPSIVDSAQSHHRFPRKQHRPRPRHLPSG